MIRCPGDVLKRVPRWNSFDTRERPTLSQEFVKTALGFKHLGQGRVIRTPDSDNICLPLKKKLRQQLYTEGELKCFRG